MIFHILCKSRTVSLDAILVVQLELSDDKLALSVTDEAIGVSWTTIS